MRCRLHFSRCSKEGQGGFFLKAKGLVLGLNSALRRTQRVVGGFHNPREAKDTCR